MWPDGGVSMGIQTMVLCMVAGYSQRSDKKFYLIEYLTNRGSVGVAILKRYLNETQSVYDILYLFHWKMV